MRLYNANSCTPVGLNNRKPTRLPHVGIAPFSNDGPVGGSYSWKSVGSKNSAEPLDEIFEIIPKAQDDDRTVSTVTTHSSWNYPNILPSDKVMVLDKYINSVVVQHEQNLSNKDALEPAKSNPVVVYPEKILKMPALSPFPRTTPPSCLKSHRKYQGMKWPSKVSQSDTASMTTAPSTDTECTPVTLTTGPDKMNDDGWCDFSTDGSENPFQENCQIEVDPFSPIDHPSNELGQVAPQVKCNPVRSKDSHCLLFPRQTMEGSMSKDIGRGRSAFVPVVRDVKSSQSKNSSGQVVLPKAIAPPSRDVEHIQNAVTNKKSKRPNTRARFDATKYATMLKTGFSFACVQKTMVRDGVDPEIIDFVSTASCAGRR